MEDRHHLLQQSNVNSMLNNPQLSYSNTNSTIPSMFLQPAHPQLNQRFLSQLRNQNFNEFSTSQTCPQFYFITNPLSTDQIQMNGFQNINSNINSTQIKEEPKEDTKNEFQNVQNNNYVKINDFLPPKIDSDFGKMENETLNLNINDESTPLLSSYNKNDDFPIETQAQKTTESFDKINDYQSEKEETSNQNQIFLSPNPSPLQQINSEKSFQLTFNDENTDHKPLGGNLFHDEKLMNVLSSIQFVQTHPNIMNSVVVHEPSPFQFYPKQVENTMNYIKDEEIDQSSNLNELSSTGTQHLIVSQPQSQVLPKQTQYQTNTKTRKSKKTRQYKKGLPPSIPFPPDQFPMNELHKKLLNKRKTRSFDGIPMNKPIPKETNQNNIDLDSIKRKEFISDLHKIQQTNISNVKETSSLSSFENLLNTIDQYCQTNQSFVYEIVPEGVLVSMTQYVGNSKLLFNKFKKIDENWGFIRPCFMSGEELKIEEIEKEMKNDATLEKLLDLYYV
ncbi:hypothetical protein QTN25_008319 [Entamoeba marina]